jgi:hypothetical protein
VACQRVAEFAVGGRSRWWPRHHDEIHRRQVALVLTKRLPHNPFDAIALYCCRRRFARDRKTQPRVLQVIGSRQHGKVLIGTANRVIEDPFELFGIEQAPLARKTRFAAKSGPVVCQDY